MGVGATLAPTLRPHYVSAIEWADEVQYHLRLYDEVPPFTVGLGIWLRWRHV